MKAGFYALFLFFAVTTHFSANAQGTTLVKDLHNDWLVFQDGQYVPFARNDEGLNTIYFKVDAQAFPGMYIAVSSPTAFSVFVNGQLTVQARTSISLNIDSLTTHYATSTLQLAIHQRRIYAEGLNTSIVARELAPAFGETLIPNFSSFRDFAIIGIMVLLAMIIVIIKLNPKLAADYFSVSKIFSLREAEDGPSKSRITNSINILFYAYSSLMLGYFLMIVYHFLPHEYPTALHFQSTTFQDAILKWAELSLIVLTLFFGKIVMVYGLSYIFGMKEIGSVHFFNWVRLLVGVFGVLTLIVFLYFIMRGTREGFYDFLLHAVAWVFAGWIVLIILKLQRQLQHSMFHLFSYICATELIPFLITVKVLYY